MSRCTGCFNSFGDNPNPHNKLCGVCIRNPKYPTERKEEQVIIDGITIDIPQDMYISRDRKAFEEQILMKKLAEAIEKLQLLEKLKRKPDDDVPLPIWNPRLKPTTWEWYWDYVHRQRNNK